MVWCLLVDNSNNALGYPFKVEVSPTMNVSNLRLKVKERFPQLLRNVSDNTLTVYRCEWQEAKSFDLSDSKVKEIGPRTVVTSLDLSGNEMLVFKKPTSDLPFINHNLKYHPVPQSSSDLMNLRANFARREELCDALYLMVCNAQVVQVRGTSACGKSVLLHLFHLHLCSKEPDTDILRMDTWPANDDTLKPLQDLNPAYPRVRKRTIVLIDDAQCTYRNSALWAHLKNLHDYTYDLHVVLFCRYGSTTLAEDPVPNPMTFSQAAMMTFWKTGTGDSDDQMPYGLLFTKAEYKDYVDRSQILLSEDLCQEIFTWSGGHIGAIEFLLGRVKIENKTNQLNGVQCTTSEFHKKNPAYKISRLFRQSIAGRGLPKPGDLQVAGMADMFRLLLRDGQIPSTNMQMHLSITTAHRNGWIYFDVNSEAYVIASPIHLVYVSWMLTSPPPSSITYTKIQDLVFDVVSRFRPSQLFLPYRAVGPPSEKVCPTEYRTYQAEFYRCLHDLTHGDVQVTPEFASGSDADRPGRLDFLVHSKKWGIELTRDGSNLQEHWNRFEDGAYEEMNKNNLLDEYILLDCCTKPVTTAHPDMKRLIHACFDFNSATVTFFDNNLKELKTCNLSTNHV